MVYKLPYSADTILNNSALTMAAHIVVSPRFEYIVDDKNWLDDTFAFQDFEGTDGAISFSVDNSLVGLFRNPISNRLSEYPEKNIFEFFESDERKVNIDKASQFMLIEFPTKSGLFHKKAKVVVPTITTSCWSKGDDVFSLDSVDEFLLHGGNYLDFLNCPRTDLIGKLSDDYEMSEFEITIAQQLADMKMRKQKAISYQKLAQLLNSDISHRILKLLKGFGIEMGD